MKRSILLIMGLLISGCRLAPGSLSPISSPSAVLGPNLPVATSSQPPTLTPSLSPSETETSSIKPSESVSETPTNTPSETQISWNYVFPVQPSNPADFSEGVASHGYPATDIFAQEGAKFVAVIDGMVDFVSYEDRWDSEHDDPALRGGLSVAIIGVDGVRYYGSHLSAIGPGISPGIQVIAGQVLGYIGHTGDARTTPSHLHFGISHPTYPEDWHTRRGEVDPFPFLVAWLDGHNVTPPLPAP